MVLRKGVENGSKVWTPIGGQSGASWPATFSGKIAKLKKVQKKETNSMTSDVMMRVME